MAKEKQNNQGRAANLPIIVEALGKKRAPDYDALKEYDVKNHDIHDIHLRPKKKIRTPSGKKDKNGKDILEDKWLDPNRIAIPLQEIIVSRRVAFMNTGKMKLYAEPANDKEQRVYDIVKKIRDDNKINFKESQIATTLNKELQVAKLWYSVDADKGHWGELSTVDKKFKMQILSPSRGDGLLPVFDNKGDLIYFGRSYEVEEDITERIGDPSWNGEVKKIKHLDIYSKEFIYRFVQQEAGEIVSTVGNNGWVLSGAPMPNPYGKIPVIYYSKPNPIWSSVQSMIDRIETVVSNFADTNDYHASPTLVFLGGKVTGKFMEKGEQGKAVSLTGDKADAKYVTWDHSVDAVKLEIDTLVNFIYSLTQTPNISFEEMKQLGALSGVAFDRVFLDAHLAARNEIEGEYGESLQRDLHLQKALVVALDPTLKTAAEALNISFEVPHFKLDDLVADVELSIKAKEGGLISQETAIEMSGLVANTEDEMERIANEEDKKGEEEKSE